MGARSASIAALLFLSAPAAADHAPVIVIPGKAGVPVVHYGWDIRGAVVHGDWGLHRPGHGRKLIEGPVFYVGPDAPGAYYPHTGRVPAYGRREIDVPRRPGPGPSFYRDWSSESDPKSPATIYPPYEPPNVTIEPRRWR